MRTSTAFFAGIGTVVVAIGAGLGGGLLLGDIMSPQQPKHPSSEVTRLEQRNSQAPISAMNTASQPVPYLASPQVAAAIAEPSHPQAEKQPSPQQTQPQQQPPQQAAVQPPDTKPSAEANKTPAPGPQPVAAVEQSAVKERAAPDDSFAKARDADVKARDADGKPEVRRADDRRKAERRQQWAEKRRIKPRGDDELRDVEASVRQATEQRPLFGGNTSDGRVRLFDLD